MTSPDSIRHGAREFTDEMLTCLWDQTCADVAETMCPAPGFGAYHVVTSDSVGQTARLDGFTITNGAAAGPNSDGDGAGIFIIDATPIVVRCTLTGNAADEGGGAHVTGTADPAFIDCSFIMNGAREGAGIHVEFGDPLQATIINCLFANNTATDHGGALDAGGFVEVLNCTFADNEAFIEGGGAIWAETDETTISNSILWANNPNQIGLDVGGSAVASFSDIQNGLPPGVTDGGGNIDADPRFTDLLGGNFRLAQLCSRCIDRADNSAVPPDTFDVDTDADTTEPTPDLDVDDRIRDGLQDGNTVVDMGSYEFLPPVCPWDCEETPDGAVGVVDFLDLLTQWGQECTTCDFGLQTPGIGTPEFLALLANWAACPESGAPEPPTLEEELDDACLTEDDWDKHVNTMTDDDFTQEEKDNSDCWMRHYILDCNRCQCPQTGHSGCPGPDPFGS